MAVYKLTREQQIAAPLQEVWDFFSNPQNLAVLTPAYMNMRVTSGELPAATYAGQIITYKVAPLLGIPLYWMTEITHVRERTFFADEQRKGPYKFWHHQHHFTEHAAGTLMQDIVHYELPFWIFGNIAHSLFVRKQLRDIFDYRAQQVARLFPGK